MARFIAFAPFGINKPSNSRKYFGKPLDFIQNNQLIAVFSMEGFNILNLLQIGAILQIEIDRCYALANIKSERCFANLTWPHQGDRGAIL